MKFANTLTEQEQWTQLPFTHTHAHTNNNRQGDVHTQKLKNKSTSMNQSVVSSPVLILTEVQALPLQ